MEKFIILGSFFGALCIIFGAFGAHALKKKLNAEQLKSFETGVKYQMYHAILLVVLGINNQQYLYKNGLIYILTIGIILFSWSIFGLVLSDAFGKKMKWLGPITPIGGLLLVMSWILLGINTIYS